MRDNYQNCLIGEAAKRYLKRHGRPAPEGFLSEFIFHEKHRTDTQGSINIRRLKRLGSPRIQFHPAIESCYVEKKKKSRIIDAGCGTGDDTRWLQENGYGMVIGIDKDSAVIDLGHAFYGDKETNDVFVAEDVLKIKPKSPFDYIFSGSLFHTMGSLQEVYDFVKVSRNALKDGGAFFGHTLGSNRHVTGFAPLQLTPDHIREAIEQAFRLDDFQVRYFREENIRFRAYYSAVPK